MRDDLGERTEPYLGPLDLPDQHEPAEGGEAGHPQASLVDEIGAILANGKTYAEAELAFQKSRAAFTADRAKGALAFGFGALALVHLALIALSVGLVLALIPVIGAWGSTALVAGIFLLGAWLLARKLRARIDAIAAAFSEKR